ncbi:MAG: hypothetical protein WCF23_18850 [Candidatus Nitrosopolaris sp.]
MECHRSEYPRAVGLSSSCIIHPYRIECLIFIDLSVEGRRERGLRRAQRKLFMETLRFNFAMILFEQSYPSSPPLPPPPLPASAPPTNAATTSATFSASAATTTS